MARRVDSILTHLGRFNAWDTTFLPGLVVLYARSSAAGKMISVAETARRRINEAEQKWWQYNRVYEAEMPLKEEVQVVEDTVLGGRRQGSDGKDKQPLEEAEGDNVDDDDEDDHYFESMQSRFERAVLGEPKKTNMVPHMSIILSRVPVKELQGREEWTVQSNQDYIDHLRKKKAGLV
jgi:hypothetical protein